MNLIVRPSEVTGRVAVPGSKSHTIRAVAAALAAGGESIVHAPLISADTISTLNAAERLGAKLYAERIAGGLPVPADIST